MFSRSQSRKKSGADTLEDTGIFPVAPLTVESQIVNNGIVVSVEPNLDIHQVELTCFEPTGVITGGQVAFLGKGSAQNSEWQPFQKDGADYVLDLATGIRSFDIPNSSLSAIAAVPVSAVTVSAGTQWVLNIISGRKG